MHLDGPVNISVHPIKDIYNLNDHLQCHAYGNPLPKYKWMTAELGMIADGSNITIDRTITRGGPCVIHCLATNLKLSISINITINISNYFGKSFLSYIKHFNFSCFA